ncbi:phospholipid/cholesterol/gamma-HCH transport system substrate-binding protein [Pseudonocardia ammonioxydans]|uniref:Phospholipid/cholesterol/gamma-HCH transport system substrate-binding protein n=1 Tax=Pseudonocardia ammonioxydans TaxID=260086 RepID=A0A1I5HQM4_PSUAM|nr:MlaD family protein [Pseudonocardia ammonioxydans]SFO50439.1 phospholipid/cholesterol/gamma-HCH transport system substrate-binding protein [Pseudonocardia ammonioxydans]
MKATALTGRGKRMSPLFLGLLTAVVALVFGAALFTKDQILTTLKPGDSITANFAEQYRLKEYSSRVKVSGVPVGTVTSVEEADDGTAHVTMKLDPGTAKKLGSAPSAAIRPTTLLGGNYYIDLVPGGDRSVMKGTIPVDRTSVPVELDKVAAALQPDALTGLQNSTGNLDGALEHGGDALKNLAKTAPGTLGPAAGVLASAQGTHPETDLPKLVQGLESAGEALSRTDGQLDSVVTGLDSLSGVLDRRGGDIATTLSTMPETLRTTDAGLKALDGTLAQVRDTAGPATPVVKELDALLGHADPVLAKARPVVSDLRDVLTDARPLVEELTPVSQDLTTFVDNLHGPVLDRVNGPILDTVNSPFHGSGPYEGGGGDNPLYQELAHMVTNLDNISATTDENGAVIGFNPGVNAGSLAGLPGVSLEQLFSNIARNQEIQR